MEFRKMALTTLHVAQQRTHRLWDSVGEGEGGMIWENSIKTSILPYVKQTTSASSNHEAGYGSWCSGTTQRVREGRKGGGGCQDGVHMYTCGWFMSMYGKNHHNTVK